MKDLNEIGLSIKEITDMVSLCPEILILPPDFISNNIEILRSINCSDNQIKDILIANPEYLNISLSDIKSLLNKLNELNIINLNFLFESNPLLLNKTSHDIDKYIISEKLKGKSIEEICIQIEENPFIID